MDLVTPAPGALATRFSPRYAAAPAASRRGTAGGTSERASLRRRTRRLCDIHSEPLFQLPQQESFCHLVGALKVAALAGGGRRDAQLGQQARRLLGRLRLHPRGLELLVPVPLALVDEPRKVRWRVKMALKTRNRLSGSHCRSVIASQPHVAGSCRARRQQVKAQERIRRKEHCMCRTS